MSKFLFFSFQKRNDLEFIKRKSINNFFPVEALASVWEDIGKKSYDNSNHNQNQQTNNE